MTSEVIARGQTLSLTWGLYHAKEEPMNSRFIALAGLLGFSLYTLITMLTAEQSLLAFGRQLLSRPDTAQVVIDLYLMALLACVWMYRDARRRGRSVASVLPYWVLTALFVSVGPLLYIVITGLRDE